MSPREVVVVTGASAGVGRAVARHFAARGADVALLARGRDGLAAAAEEVEAAGRRALVLSADVARPEEVEAAADETETRLGAIDVWVNNAMVSVMAPFVTMTAEEYRRVTEVTYLGTVHGTMSALRRMLVRDRGAIVQVGSALAYRAIPLQSAYCGAKHAIQGFTDSLRTELRHDRSRVHLTSVQLPALNTPQFSWARARLRRHPQPVPPIYQPEVAAAAIWWAAHHRRRELWVGAPTALTILGQRLAPGMLERYLARTGFDAQQIDRPLDPDRPDNLFEPIPGDHGARGVFDDAAHDRSLQLWAATRRRGLGMAGTVLGTAAAARWFRSGAATGLAGHRKETG